MPTHLESLPDEPSWLLTARQLAEQLQVSPRSIWRLRKAGQLPEPLVIGGAVRWDRQVVREWIATGCPALPSRAGCD
jgi:predicted DNA-binding transcriptional regulator AlpA